MHPTIVDVSTETNDDTKLAAMNGNLTATTNDKVAETSISPSKSSLGQSSKPEVTDQQPIPADTSLERIGVGADDEHTEKLEVQNGRRSRKRVTMSYPMIESGMIYAKSPSPKKKRQRHVQTKEEEMSWICTECKEAEALADKDSDLLLCEGQCNRPFHTVCVGLKEQPKEDEIWICSDCQSGRHYCCVCQEYGRDDVDVFKCQNRNCGLFFHESCLSAFNVDVKLVPIHKEMSKDDNEKSLPSDHTTDHHAGLEHNASVPETKPAFRCPAHRCWTCTEEMVIEEEVAERASPKTGKKSKAKKKDNAFSTKTGTLFLPTLDMESSVQGQLERDAEQKLENINKPKRVSSQRRQNEVPEEENTFFLGLRGDEITVEEHKLLGHVENYFLKNEDESPPKQLQDLMFCLPCDIKEEVYSKPPSFRLVHSLRYDPANKPKRKDPSGESCKCNVSGLMTCDESCHNRIMFIECAGDESKGTGIKNPYWNCDVGPGCGNRAISLRQAAKCKPVREQGKGWGLVTLQPLKKGDFAQEYVGEIIDEKKKEARLSEWTKDHPNDPNFYIMQLEAGWYIDARVEANLSRFINHSCAPNCVLKRMNVAGFTRIGIFAEHDIAPGQFLSYDYRFDTKHGDKFICRCGASNCRGTMKDTKQAADDEDEKKTVREVLNAAKVREEKDRRFLEEARRIQDQNSSQVDAMIPSFDYPNEFVAMGPYERYRFEGQANRVFLWRNILAGGNFSNRAMLLDMPSPKHTGDRQLISTKIDLLASMKK